MFQLDKNLRYGDTSMEDSEILDFICKPFSLDLGSTCLPWVFSDFPQAKFEQLAG